MNEEEDGLPDFNHTEEQEYFEWLDKLEKQKVAELDKHLKRNFDEIFGEDHEREKLIPEQK